MFVFYGQRVKSRAPQIRAAGMRGPSATTRNLDERVRSRKMDSAGWGQAPSFQNRLQAVLHFGSLADNRSPATQRRERDVEDLAGFPGGRGPTPADTIQGRPAHLHQTVIRASSCPGHNSGPSISFNFTRSRLFAEPIRQSQSVGPGAASSSLLVAPRSQPDQEF